MSTPHNQNPSRQPSRLDELLAAACNGKLTPEQTAELDAILLHDPKARIAYLQHLHVEAKLHRIFRSKAALAPGETNAFQQALAAIVDPPTISAASVEADPHTSLHDAAIMPALADFDDASTSSENYSDPFVSLPPKKLGFSTARPRIAIGWMWPMAAVLFLTLSVALVFLLSRPRFAPASLAATIDASWDSTTPAPLIGQHLPRTPLSLHDGLAHLLFDNGTDVVIQGPAQFQITSASEITLSLGQLTAHVSSPAIGFTIKTPHANVTDLGTEFGINVSPDQQTHAEVFTGKVRATASDLANPDPAAPNRTLTAGVAVNIPNAANIQDAPASPLSFVRPAQFTDFQQEGGTAYARWRSFSQQLRSDPHLLAYYPLDKPVASHSDDNLLNDADLSRGNTDGKIHNAAWQSGRFPEKSALLFNGSDSVAVINIPGSFHQLSYAVWIKPLKIQHEFTSLVTSQLVSVKNQSSASAPPGVNGVCHLSLVENNKTPLSIRMGISDDSQLNHWSNFDFRAPSLVQRANEWHLVVLSCDLEHHLVRCWIDAQLIDEIQTPLDLPLQIGPADIGNRTGSARGFDGSLDELALWNRSLSTPEVQSIYKAGLPH